MKKILCGLTLLLAVTGRSYAQHTYNYDYTGSWIPKVNLLTATDGEIGFGLAAEYRIQRLLSIQMEIDYLSPIVQEAAQSGNGIRIRPEGRIYIPHRKESTAHRHFDFYAGLEFTFKYIRTDFAEWITIGDNSPANTYQQYVTYSTTNTAFGPVLKTGFQWYPGSARRLVIDASAGLGPTFNNISIQNQSYPVSQLERPTDDGLSYNKYPGTFVYLNFDFRIGYRL